MYQVGDRVVHPMHGGGDHRKYRAGTAGRTAGQLLRVPNALRRADAEDPPQAAAGAIGVRALSTSGRIREVLSAIPGAGDRPHHQLEPTLSGEPEPAEER